MEVSEKQIVVEDVVVGKQTGVEVAKKQTATAEDIAVGK